VLLIFIKEKPLATTIERDVLPESLEIDGATRVDLDSDLDAELDELDRGLDPVAG